MCEASIPLLIAANHNVVLVTGFPPVSGLSLLFMPKVDCDDFRDADRAWQLWYVVQRFIRINRITAPNGAAYCGSFVLISYCFGAEL